MKLTVQNLGRIDRAEFDIRPLTVFIGENGTNKTWVAYALYGLMRRWPPRLLGTSYSLGDDEDAAITRLRKDNETLARELARGGDASVSLIRDFAQYFPKGAIPVEVSGDASFWSLLLRLPKSQSTLDVKFHLGIEVRPVAEPVRVTIQPSGVGIRVNISISPSKAINVLVDSPTMLLDESYWKNVLELAFHHWLSPFQGRAFVLPAERKALASTYDLGDDFQEAVSVPPSDYATFLNVQRRQPARGLAPGKTSPLRSFASVLEAQIVKGAVGFTPDSEGPRFSFRPSEQVELPIQAASSLVRALAGLDLYLKTIAEPGDYLFIDEIEMNAHPEAQLALTEFLAMLVNRGLHVVMTTHSPYVVEHLNNLMAASRLLPERQEELVSRFKLKSREAFLPADKVAAYGFTPAGEKVAVSDILNRDTQEIDWRTFSHVTDELSNLYGLILDAEERK